MVYAINLRLMNISVINTLKIFRNGYKLLSKKRVSSRFSCDNNPDTASEAILNILTSDKGCMIARFGSTEMNCLCNYIGVKNERGQYLNFIKGISNSWWWEPSIVNQMQQWSGFFPSTTIKIEEFCELMLNDIPEVDILGSWLPQELYFEEELKSSYKVNLELLNPYFSKVPWTKALEGKKVLVVHPFAKTIRRQYKRRNLLFSNDLLPEFELKVIPAIQSIAGEKTDFKDWFAALEYMKSEIDKEDYDICLIGAGAYGFPLAAHVKRMGKKGFHIGGSLQLLFGIRGRRWENESYNNTYNYARLMNDYWVKPDEKEVPKDALKVEGGCYW